MGNNNTLPNFIKAKSAKSLRSLMIKNNVRLNMSYVDYTVLHDGKHFYAWYAEPIWENTELKE
jgi:hypothetical protein